MRRLMTREKSRPVNCKREILWKFDNLKIYKDLSRKALVRNRHIQITLSLFLKASLGTHTFPLKWDFIHMQV